MAKPPPPATFAWTAGGLPTRAYAGGHCDNTVASDRGYQSNNPNVGIHVCPQCRRTTVFEGNDQSPGVAYGAPVKHLPTEVDQLYEQARLCCSAGAYTAAVLLLRKLLM